MAKPVKFEGDGPFETLSVAAFVGLVHPEGEESVRLRFRLEDGSELRLPCSPAVLEKVEGLFAAMYSARKKLRGDLA